MADQVSGFLSPLLRTRRIDVVRPYIRGRVLDYGCGIGALGQYVAKGDYTGVDIDSESLEIAALRYPHHHFALKGDLGDRREFDTIICLAVIEHVPSPADLLRSFVPLLSHEGQIVLTTPNPPFEWIHGLGARVGLFSREGHDEHQSLIDEDAIRKLGEEVGLHVKVYRRFLFGANQLVVLVPRHQLELTSTIRK